MVTKIKKTKESKQPEVNLGLVGHVDHGKTTLLQALTGKWADVHSEEIKRGITIKLGYADLNIYNCPTHNYSNKQQCKDCKIHRIVSFVDAPGHETLMATMLSGAAIMDGALLLIAANENCPQPQTKEHLMALEIIGIKNIIIVQNKIDIVTKDQVLENYKQIKEFIKGTIAEKAPIIPVSAVHKININKIIEAIEELVPTPKRDLGKDPIMLVARSFDINKPGTEIDKLVGGVIGGSIKEGVFNLDEEIEITPGRSYIEKNVEKWKALKTKIVGIKTGGESAKEANPGGSIALMTDLDPSIIKSDQLAGAIISKKGKGPEVWTELNLKPELLKRVVGSKDEINVEPIKKNEPLMLNVNSATTAGIVINIEKNRYHIKLKRPVAAFKGANMAISRRIGTRWRLIGTAKLE